MFYCEKWWKIRGSTKEYKTSNSFERIEIPLWKIQGTNLVQRDALNLKKRENMEKFPNLNLYYKSSFVFICLNVVLCFSTRVWVVLIPLWEGGRDDELTGLNQPSLGGLINGDDGDGYDDDDGDDGDCYDEYDDDDGDDGDGDDCDCDDGVGDDGDGDDGDAEVACYMSGTVVMMMVAA